MVKTQTRKKRITGTLGEGFYGIAYNNRSNTFYEQFKKEEIMSIRLCTLKPKDEQILTDRGDIDSFLHFLRHSRDLIIKTYKTTFLLTATRRKDNFATELGENRTILGLYGAKANRHLTIYPITGFRDLSILGAVLVLKNHSTFNMLFGHKCDNHYSMKAHKMLQDILKSLVILQDNQYLHNDIKLENIVLCNNTYKLIDWGQAGNYTQFNMGDMIGTSPIKWYLMGFPDLYTDNILALRTQMVNSDFKFSKIFEEVHQQVYDEFHEIIIYKPSYKSLIKKYINTFDIFMAGMMLLRAIHKFKLNKATFLPIVKQLVSLTSPLDAKEALALLSKKN